MATSLNLAEHMTAKATQWLGSIHTVTTKDRIKAEQQKVSDNKIHLEF